MDTKVFIYKMEYMPGRKMINGLKRRNKEYVDQEDQDTLRMSSRGIWEHRWRPGRLWLLRRLDSEFCNDTQVV